MLEIHLASHAEPLSMQNAFGEAITGPLFLDHQRRTAEAVPNYPLTINTYATGAGKTRAALLGWLAISQQRRTALPNMLFIAPTNELIKQHVDSIQSFASQASLDVHVIHVDAASLRALPTPHEHERVGERLNRLIENPQEKGYVGQKPMAVVTNPDIFYYALYFAAYNPIDRRNLFERFLLRFDYVVIDEFHYYSPKQLACFLFFFALCKEWGYFKHGRRICLLSATPESEIRVYLERLFEPDEMAWITPEDEPSSIKELQYTPALTPLTLRIIPETIDDFAKSIEGQTLLRQWLDAGREGALISDALWRINAAHAALRRAGFDDDMARLTGAERIERRRVAARSTLLLATPTVDIGYNFAKPSKLRQPLDFIVFDTRTRDTCLQRLGRAGRVLGQLQTDVLSDAIALVDDETYQHLQPLHGRKLTRLEFADHIRSVMRPRFDLYAYVRSYAVLEAFRPIFNLERMIRPDLHEWVERLFERVRDVFAPDSRRHHYWGLRKELQFHTLLERIVRRREDENLPNVVEKYAQWLGEGGLALGDKAIPQIKQAVRSDERTRLRIKEWAERQYHLTESLFNFREALQTPTAFIYDPRHLLSDSDTTLYDALHVEANFKADWFANRSTLQRAMNIIDVQAEEADAYCHIQQWRETRLSFSFDYREDNLPRKRFEQLYLCRPTVLRGLLLRAHISGQEEPYRLDPTLRRAFEDKWLPCFIVPLRDEGRLRGLLYGRDIFLRYVNVSFGDRTVSYPAIVGTAAFMVHAELERYLRYRERVEDHAAIIV
jgi:CRISPR-associated endonuclease/helicase Cas3